MSTPPGWTRQPAAKPFARWSADTEQAFLFALRLTGRVRDAAAAIGRSTATAYVRRRRDAGFAARWDAVVEEQQTGWIAEQGKAVRALADEPLGDLRLRRDGWSEARRKLFLRALSETGSVRDACARARISSTSAYRLRDQCARFAGDWEKALATQAVTIEQVAYERAVIGWEEPIVQGGQIVGQRWRYSESLLRALVLHEQRAAGPAMAGAAGRRGGRGHGAQYQKPLATREETNAALAKALAGAQRRMALAQEAEWARWRACWGTSPRGEGSG
ncbi:hypothetical protein E5A73_13470 [Sphingomonas gei]|uniref:Uncharacterized protein n=1 Tax=Sphingomonas gei TaxID=1395960 RepID=A0A4S1XAD0_9SPHN|nr:hypothetical protein [Sphingomonas gei]TGX52653.1 hypothetical protein E5A73_13470 [Sphingomonas gei]